MKTISLAARSAIAAALALSAAASSAQAPAAAPPPAWKQGMPASMANSPLAPHAGKMTVTPANEIPIDRIKLP
ncbi:MAG: sorbosone dehydrogenase family protein, partial [Betaproteobacteria bacterium]